MLTLGISPCPNDTFAFHHLIEGGGLEVLLDDVEALNRRAELGNLDVVKVSVAAYGRLRRDYALLRAGGAAGYGVGPIVVAREKRPTELHHPKAGTIKVTGNPVKLSDTPGEITVPPPLLGQHTQEVLEGLGYSAKDIEELRQAKLI